MDITVKNLTPWADTNAQGDLVFPILHDALKNGPVTLSFAGIDTVTTSFVNSCLIPLLDHFPFSQIKSDLRVTDSSKQINDVIRSMLVCAAARIDNQSPTI